jgi:polar amino acid transport system substrate-binding protein
MKNKGKIVACTILCMLLVQNSAFSTEVLRITTGEWPPYISQDLPHYGIGLEIVRQAFALEGVTVAFEFLPWMRAFAVVKAGERDATALWGTSPEREPYMYYSDTVLQDDVYFFHLKEFNFDWKSIDDLEGLTIGGSLGYNYGDAFRAAEEAKHITVQWAPDNAMNLRKLMVRRIDIFPVELATGKTMLAELFGEEKAALFTHHPIPVRKVTYHLLLSKAIPRNAQMIVLFNRGLTKLKDSGVYDQLLKALSGD